MASIDELRIQFQRRVDQIKKWAPPVNELLEALPEIPLHYEPKDKELAAIKLGLFTGSTAGIAMRASRAFTLLWENNHFIMLSLQTRFLYELWSATNYASIAFLRMEQTGDIKSTLEVLQRLLTGTRYNIELPWGEVSNLKSLHVMDLIRELDKTKPEASDSYDYLCESCHPSFMQLSYWSLMERSHVNKKFFTTAKEMIKRIITETESAQTGITSDVVAAVDFCQRYITM